MSLFNRTKQDEYWERKKSSWGDIKNTPVISELGTTFEESYQIVNKKKLESLISESQIITVCGAYFGDEGKGKITHALAELDSIKAVARVNSGANAGHTVYHQGIKMVFHVMPSAITSDKPCYIGHETVIDPISFVDKEIEQLIRNDINYENLKVGNFFITTPYHRIMDLLKSEHNSSTGVGIAPSHSSKMWKTSPRLDDLFNSNSTLERIFEKDLKHYWGFVAERGLKEEDMIIKLQQMREDPRTIRKVPPHLLEFLTAENKSTFLIDIYKQNVVNNELFPKQVNVEKELNEILKKGQKIILEGPQSYFLSNGIQQCHRHGTSAYTHSSGIVSSANLNIDRYKVLTINVAKFPGSSRVGIGNIPSSFTEQDRFSSEGIDDFSNLEGACLNFDEIQKFYFSSIKKNGILEPTIYKDKTGDYLICEAMAISSSQYFNEKGATTNKPRIVGLYDCVMGAQVAETQGPNLVISAMDRGDLCDEVGITIGYVVNLPKEVDFSSDKNGKFIYSNGIKYRSGDIIKAGDQVPNSQVLHYCHSITKVLQGWKDTPIGSNNEELKEGSLLPKNPSRVISEIENYTGFNVIAIGNGVNGENLLYLNKNDDVMTKINELTQ